jgi:hypothetical protein
MRISLGDPVEQQIVACEIEGLIPLGPAAEERLVAQLKTAPVAAS